MYLSWLALATKLAQEISHWAHTMRRAWALAMKRALQISHWAHAVRCAWDLAMKRALQISHWAHAVRCACALALKRDLHIRHWAHSLRNAWALCCEVCPVDKSLGSCRKVCPSRMVSSWVSILITSWVLIVSTSWGVLAARLINSFRNIMLLFNTFLSSTSFVSGDCFDFSNHGVMASRS